MAQKDEYSRQSSKQNGKVHILLNVFSAIHFHFYMFPTNGFSSFFSQISRFFDFDLQVFGLLGLRSLHYIDSTLKFTTGFFKGSFYKIFNYALSAQPCSFQPPCPFPAHEATDAPQFISVQY